MDNLIDDIKKIKFETGQNFSFDLDREFELIASQLNLKEKELLKNDFKFFLEKGKFLIHNSIGGGILFLKVPELIEKICINSRMENDGEFEVTIIFESDTRKTENIKYKLHAGKIESTKWHVRAIFPNFYQYEIKIQKSLLIIVGKIVKNICEYGRKNFAYMKIENEFDIELLINGHVESKLKVEFT